MRLKVRNFQAVVEATLDIEGLTVVTGKSNAGKTALIRAAAATLFGLPGDHFIRRGEDWTSGSIELDDPKDPLKISWRKVPAQKRKPNLQPSLEINGTEHSKIGRDHRQLTAKFGLTELETTATRLRPQVAMQHDPIFLVGENETTCAEVFKFLGRIDTITAAQNSVRSDLRETEQRRKLRTEDLKEAQNRAAELAYVPALVKELATLRATLEAAEEREASRELAREKLRTLAELKPTTILTTPQLPDVTAQTQLGKLLQELTRLRPTPSPEIPPEPPRELPHRNLTELLSELQATEEELKELRTKDLELTRDEDQHHTTMTAFKAQLKICPTCGQKLSLSA